MALDGFIEEDVETAFGQVRLWATPPDPEGGKPLLFAIPGVLSGLEDIAAHLRTLGFTADGVLMRLPSSRDTALTSGGFSILSDLISALLESRYAHRKVVVLGVSTGATIALGVRAQNLVRIVAVEPVLTNDNLWPLARVMPEHLRRAADPIADAFAFDALGIAGSRAEQRNHLAVLDRPRVPVDIVLGGVALEPPRELARLPSLVDVAVRTRLAAQPRVRIYELAGAGHNVLGQAGRDAHELILEACRRASDAHDVDRLAIDEPLLEAIPLNARRVLYMGNDGPAFARAIAAANPQASVDLVTDMVSDTNFPKGSFDTLVLSRQLPDDQLAPALDLLCEGGVLVARWGKNLDSADQCLRSYDLTPRASFDECGTGVVRARKPASDAAPVPILRVQSVAYATGLLDIRTRLPTQGLRTDPDLRVSYHTTPFELLPAPVDEPKVLVLARTAEMPLAGWRPFLSRAIRAGWIVVNEFDDYPPLVAEMLGLPSGPEQMVRFGYAHGVQTTTPPLVEAFRPYNSEVAMFPNAVFELPPFREGSRPRRVFYGGVTRGPFAVDVAAALGPVVQRLPDTEFVVVGDRAVFEALPTDRRRYYNYMSFGGYLSLMSECSVSISPVKPGFMQDAKSDAKFLDAARVGAVTVASPTVYDRVVAHGENGLLADNLDDWAPALLRVLGDQTDRQRMARKAWEYVREERMFAHQVSARREWYRSLWERREALNEALMSRVPGLRELVAA